ncbi:MAG: sarcosine oxidase subunit gamma SoxG [Desulfococcaceae bacterium]
MTAKRISPVAFEARPAETEERDGWNVVLGYANEGDGPHLTDLSHRARWDVQAADLSAVSPAGVALPETPGAATLTETALAFRTGGKSAGIWHLAGDAPGDPTEPVVTDVSEGLLLLALTGPRVFRITERLTALDLEDPNRNPPFVTLGPFSHVPCQVAVLGRESERAGGVLIACSRGYGADMVHALLDAGKNEGLRPAGERCFQSWLAKCFG